MQEMRQLFGPRRQLPNPNQTRVRNDRVNYLPRVWSKETLSNREGATFKKEQLRRLQSRSRRDMNATIWIGKQGTTDQLLKQVTSQLKTRELVKLKVHKSALRDINTIAIAGRIAESTNSTLVDVMGHTFTLYKKKERAKNPEKS